MRTLFSGSPAIHLDRAHTVLPRPNPGRRMLPAIRKEDITLKKQLKASIQDHHSKDSTTSSELSFADPAFIVECERDAPAHAHACVSLLLDETSGKGRMT